MREIVWIGIRLDATALEGGRVDGTIGIKTFLLIVLPSPFQTDGAHEPITNEFRICIICLFIDD